MASEYPQDAPIDFSRHSDSERHIAQLAALVETSGEALISVSPNGIILTWNPAAERLFGYAEAEAVGQNITLITPQRDHSREGIAGGVLKEGRIVRLRAERLHKCGASIPVAICAAPMRNQAGEIIGVSSIISDISSLLRAEEQQKLMMRELAHRGKNLLAVVQSIARRSLTDKDCTPEAREGFIERIAAMARTYQTLNAEGFAGAKLSELVRLELETFVSRVHAEGPDVLLRTNEAQIFGMMLHELVTNAVKYGALSTDTGSIVISWDVDTSVVEPVFSFEWREAGGPQARVSSRQGFGSTLITGVVEQSFGAKPIVEFTKEGLCYRFETPLAQIGRRIESNPLRSRIRSGRMRTFFDCWWREGGDLVSFESLEQAVRDVRDYATVMEVDLSRSPAGLTIVSRGQMLTRVQKRFDISLGDDCPRDIPGSIEATYRRCARLREAMYEFSIVDIHAQNAPVHERLFVPCARDGKNVTHVVGLSMYSNVE